MTTSALTVTAGSATRSKGAALAVLALAQLMVVLDTTIVNVALPSIQRKLHFHSAADLQWVVNIYVLTAGGFLLLGGRVADRYGRRLVFVAGTTVFAVGSLVCGVANSSALLVAARAVQGLGSAFMAPAALSLLTGIFADGEERNRALGVWSAIAGAGGAIGLLVGGVFTTELSWRWIFFVNLPIAAFAALASLRLIDESRDASAGGFDVPGAITGTAGLGALVFALVRANVWGWGSAKAISLLAGAIILVSVFVVLQLRVPHPLVPPRLFRSRNLVGADVGMLIAGAGIFAVFFFLTLYMQNVLHYSALKTGVAYLPLSVVLVAGAGVGANALARVGARRLLVGSFLLAAGGMLLLARLSPTSGYIDMLWPLLLMGAGMGLTFVSVTTSAVAGVPPADTGVASALLNASQQLGGSLGLATLTAVASARFDAVRPRHPTPAALAAASTSSWAYAFVAGASLLVGAAIVGGILLRPTAPMPEPAAPMPEPVEPSHADEPIKVSAPESVPATAGARSPTATPSPSAVVRDMARCGCHG